MYRLPTTRWHLALYWLVLGLMMAALPQVAVAEPEESIDYNREIQPLFAKYCAGCHNETDAEGDFSVASVMALVQGTSDGAVIVPGKPDESRLIQLMNGTTDSVMPPEDEPRPTKEEIARIEAWIAEGQSAIERAMRQTSQLTGMQAPKLEPAELHRQYVGSATATADSFFIGRLGRLEKLSVDGQVNQDALTGLPGKVNSLRASPDGKLVVVGTGVTGLGGEALLVRAADMSVVARFQGHSDAIYCATLSHDGRRLATGSYDRKILIWNTQSGEIERELTGHNGAIYDLDFDPKDQVLASASADQTVKLWNVESGERLDTLGQPEGEMYCVRFSADGRFVLAGGSDRQIRKWQLVSRDGPAINPLIIARYAHESAILQMEFIDDQFMLTASDDHKVKLWQSDLRPLGELATLQDVPVSIAATGNSHVVAIATEISGATHSITREQVEQLVAANKAMRNATRKGSRSESSGSQSAGDLTEVNELEPNQTIATGTQVQLPARIQGVIDAGSDPSLAEDVDLYRFDAEAGQQWLIEVEAASQKSKLDSRIDVLSEDGTPVVRTRLQALRASYFTFRGKDSDTSDDFRLHKWEDMELDEYLYAGGEVTRLWLYPRGPDSGFKVYPGFGKRYTFFDTTAVTHALGAPAYVVRPLGLDEDRLPNGLPVFDIFFENDDDAQRRAGRDSRLSFVAPKTGTYFLRVRDARGFGGEDFQYQINIKRPQPDFLLKLGGQQLKVPKGSGREWSVTATRREGLQGPITIRLQDVPDGWEVTNPVVIEANQDRAFGAVFATSEASAPEAADGEEEASHAIRLLASYEVGGQLIERELEDHLELSLTDTSEVHVKLFPADPNEQEELTELTIQPGQTISARLVVERNGTESRIGFGKEDSGRNLPHGAFVDNIGLNGLLIPEKQTEREFFITAAPKVPLGRRQFHVRSDTKGNPISRPVWLNVVAP